MGSRLREGWEWVTAGVLPLAQWEMRALMRGGRAPALLLACAGVEVALGPAVLWHALDAGPLSLEAYVQGGRRLFTMLCLAEGGLAALLVPPLAGGLLAREYARRTLDDLLLTRLTAREIVLGKLLASSGFFGIVLLCGLPVLAVAFIFGGVSPGEIACAQLYLLAAAGLFSAIGLRCAIRFRRPAAAILAGWAQVVWYLAAGISYYAAAMVVTSPDWLPRPVVRRNSRFFNAFALLELLGMLLLMMIAPFVMMAVPFVLHPAAAFGIIFRQGQWGILEYCWWLLPLLGVGVLVYTAATLLPGKGERTLHAAQEH